MGEELQTLLHLGDFLVKAELSSTPGMGDRASKINDFLNRLQEEMIKIDAFKRELPLSVILLNDAIEALKGEANHVNPSSVDEPVLAEFIPLRRSNEEDEEGQEVKIDQKESDPKDKKNWMSSVQLWSSIPDHHHIQSTAQTPILKPQSKDERELSKATVVLRNRSGADLMEEQSSSGSGSASASVPFMRMLSCGRSSTGKQQPARKRRRCWAPELHRQFVNALEKLGGPQVATPKQIRELMQVDGLTNDEVKSHLQKYRLYSQRLPSTNDGSPSNQSIVLGNQRDTHEAGNKCREFSRVSYSQSGSPQGPFQQTNNKSPTSLTRGDSMEEDDGDESRS